MIALKPRAGNVSADILRDFKRQDIDLILAAARVRRFPARSVMTHQGEPAEHLWLLWKGRARYFFETPNGKKLILIWITPGHCFGEAALSIRASPYLASTETVRDSVVLAWDGPTIRGLARSFPQLLENVIVSAWDYLSWYVAAHAALCSQTARQRLAGVLLGCTSSMGERVSGGIEFDITNEELANAANINPYTVSDILGEWRRDGAIHKRRGKIFVRSAERLFLRETLE